MVLREATTIHDTTMQNGPADLDPSTTIQLIPSVQLMNLIMAKIDRDTTSLPSQLTNDGSVLDLPIIHDQVERSTETEEQTGDVHLLDTFQEIAVPVELNNLQSRLPVHSGKEIIENLMRVYDAESVGEGDDKERGEEEEESRARMNVMSDVIEVIVCLDSHPGQDLVPSGNQVEIQSCPPTLLNETTVINDKEDLHNRLQTKDTVQSVVNETVELGFNVVEHTASEDEGFRETEYCSGFSLPLQNKETLHSVVIESIQEVEKSCCCVTSVDEEQMNEVNLSTHVCEFSTGVERNELADVDRLGYSSVVIGGDKMVDNATVDNSVRGADIVIGWDARVDVIGCEASVDVIGCDARVDVIGCEASVDVIGCDASVDVIGCDASVDVIGCDASVYDNNVSSWEVNSLNKLDNIVLSNIEKGGDIKGDDDIIQFRSIDTDITSTKQHSSLILINPQIQPILGCPGDDVDDVDMYCPVQETDELKATPRQLEKNDTEGFQLEIKLDDSTTESPAKEGSAGKTQSKNGLTNPVTCDIDRSALKSTTTDEIKEDCVLLHDINVVQDQMIFDATPDKMNFVSKSPWTGPAATDNEYASASSLIDGGRTLVSSKECRESFEERATLNKASMTLGRRRRAKQSGMGSICEEPHAVAGGIPVSTAAMGCLPISASAVCQPVFEAQADWMSFDLQSLATEQSRDGTPESSTGGMSTPSDVYISPSASFGRLDSMRTATRSEAGLPLCLDTSKSHRLITPPSSSSPSCSEGGAKKFDLDLRDFEELELEKMELEEAARSTSDAIRSASTALNHDSEQPTFNMYEENSFVHSPLQDWEYVRQQIDTFQPPSVNQDLSDRSRRMFSVGNRQTSEQHCTSMIAAESRFPQTEYCSANRNNHNSSFQGAESGYPGSPLQLDARRHWNNRPLPYDLSTSIAKLQQLTGCLARVGNNRSVGGPAGHSVGGPSVGGSVGHSASLSSNEAYFGNESFTTMHGEQYIEEARPMNDDFCSVKNPGYIDYQRGYQRGLEQHHAPTPPPPPHSMHMSSLSVPTPSFNTGPFFPTEYSSQKSEFRPGHSAVDRTPYPSSVIDRCPYPSEKQRTPIEDNIVVKSQRDNLSMSQLSRTTPLMGVGTLSNILTPPQSAARRNFGSFSPSWHTSLIPGGAQSCGPKGGVPAYHTSSQWSRDNGPLMFGSSAPPPYARPLLDCASRSCDDQRICNTPTSYTDCVSPEFFGGSSSPLGLYGAGGVCDAPLSQFPWTTGSLHVGQDIQSRERIAQYKRNALFSGTLAGGGCVPVDIDMRRQVISRSMRQ